MILSFVTGQLVTFTYPEAIDPNKWHDGVFEDYCGEYCIIVMELNSRDRVRYRIHHTFVRPWRIIGQVDEMVGL